MSQAAKVVLRILSIVIGVGIYAFWTEKSLSEILKNEITSWSAYSMLWLIVHSAILSVVVCALIGLMIYAWTN